MLRLRLERYVAVASLAMFACVRRDADYLAVRNPDAAPERGLVLRVAQALCNQRPTRCSELEGQDVLVTRCDAQCSHVLFEGRLPAHVDGGVLLHYDDGAGGIVCEGEEVRVRWGGRDQGCRGEGRR